MSRKIDYKKSGVDVAKASSLVSWIKKMQVDPSIGGDYGSMYPLSLQAYKQPVLVSSTDGVGTKVKFASHFKKWDSIGQDLVAMCVNDLICLGAKPLFFLDYYACGKLNTLAAKAFLRGLHQACAQASCPLIGGETAELPGLYQKQDFDCAGFSVGLVEKSKILGMHKVKRGDKVIGIKSSGFHSNGYSLLRKVYKKQEWSKHKSTFLKPTRLYTFLADHFNKLAGLRALAHITGGGLNNISRILPKNLQAQLEPWLVPSCFLDVKARASLSWPDLLGTFNCGVGLIAIVSKEQDLKGVVKKEDMVFLGSIVTRKNTRKSWSLDFKKMQACQK